MVELYKCQFWVLLMYGMVLLSSSQGKWRPNIACRYTDEGLLVQISPVLDGAAYYKIITHQPTLHRFTDVLVVNSTESQIVYLVRDFQNDRGQNYTITIRAYGPRDEGLSDYFRSDVCTLTSTLTTTKTTTKATTPWRKNTDNGKTARARVYTAKSTGKRNTNLPPSTEGVVLVKDVVTEAPQSPLIRMEKALFIAMGIVLGCLSIFIIVMCYLKRECFRKGDKSFLNRQESSKSATSQSTVASFSRQHTCPVRRNNNVEAAEPLARQECQIEVPDTEAERQSIAGASERRNSAYTIGVYYA